jgi:hypothetical protein
MTDNWHDLKDALDRMAKLPPRTDFHITEVLADKVKNELDRLKARGFPAPKLLTEEDGDLSLVWRSAGFSIYYVISVGEEPYFSVLTTTAPAPQDILDWIKTLPKEPNEKLREAWAMYQAVVKQPAPAPDVAEVFILEALLAINPSNPQWGTVTDRVVNGYKTLPPSEHRLSGYRFGSFWNDCIAWTDEATAREQFALLLKHPQRYDLRLVRDWRSKGPVPLTPTPVGDSQMPDVAGLVDRLPRFVPPQAAVAGVPFREAVWLDDLRAALAAMEEARNG